MGEGDLSLRDPEAPPTDALATRQYGATATADDDGKHKPNAPTSIPVPHTKKGGGGGGDDTAEQGRGDGGENKSVISQITSTKPHVPAQNPCLWLFHLLQGIAALTSLLLLVTQLMPMFMTSNKPDILSSILKVYVSFICLAFVIVEAELPVPFVRGSTLLNTFASRGFIYSFIGLVCTTEAYSERVDDLMTHANQRFYVGWAAVFMQVVAWLMFGIGVAYMLLGICCMRRLRDKMKQKEKDAWKQYREDMRAWRRRHHDE